MTASKPTPFAGTGGLLSGALSSSVDVALIDRAEHEIDMAAYVLTDWPVMQALTRAADPRCEGAHLSRRVALGL
jgi:hypothetical protein